MKIGSKVRAILQAEACVHYSFVLFLGRVFYVREALPFHVFSFLSLIYVLRQLVGFGLVGWLMVMICIYGIGMLGR